MNETKFGRYLASVEERDIDLLLMEEFQITDEFVIWFCNDVKLDRNRYNDKKRPALRDRCPLSGTKRTFVTISPMSAYDPGCVKTCGLVESRHGTGEGF